MPYRYFIVGITAVAALWMYIDRVCFSTLADPIQKDLEITAEEKGYMLGAFFLTYALFQIPMGSLADRYGARLVLAISIAAWSLVTAATGFVESFAALLAIRLMLGITESSAYPAAAGLVKNWAKPGERGRFSSWVALGGRLGGALAPLLTAFLAVQLVGIGPPEWLNNAAGVNWRGVLLSYGLCGLAVAVAFWLLVRDRPTGAESHAETELADDWHQMPKEAMPKSERNFFQRVALLASTRNLWYFGGVQFGVNVGWAFVITLLPTYLNEVFAVPLEKRGQMQTVVLVTGCCGMFVGGFFTDFMRAKLGPRFGRSVPIGVALTGCAIALFVSPLLPTPWTVVAALGVMACLVDMHNPSIWSFAQDVGGKNVGAALGWGNMWGNLGAALSPVLMTAIQKSAGWNAVFIVGGSAFVTSAISGFMLDASKPIEDDSD